jgi:hypothetical protein
MPLHFPRCPNLGSRSSFIRALPNSALACIPQNDSLARGKYEWYVGHGCQKKKIGKLIEFNNLIGLAGLLKSN